jgi:hypothetical protein
LLNTCNGEKKKEKEDQREEEEEEEKKNAQKGIREIEGEGEEGGKFMEQLRIEFDAVQGQSVAKALSAYLPACPW